MTATDQAQPRLRDLDEPRFLGDYGCDRYTATVLANRFEYVLEHVCTRLLTCAFSPILRDLYDFGATVTGPRHLDYPTPVVGKGLALFTGTMTESVKNTVEEFGPDRLRPGDVLVANDPYRTGTHVNDVLFIRPVFVDDEILCFVTIKAHQLDIGGSVPGGFSATKTSIFENGLVLSPRLLARDGELVPETWSLVMDNARFGELLGADMRTIVACLELGADLMSGSAERYGREAVWGTMRYVTDADAERMADALAALPDGEWTASSLVDADGVSPDEEYPVTVTLRKVGPRLEVDLSGTARQARSSINATALDAKTGVGIALKYLFDADYGFTSGLYRCVDLVLPDASIASAYPPDGVVFTYGEITGAIVTAIMRAFADALGDAAVAGDYGSPSLHTGFGVTPEGFEWVSSGVGGGEHGPWGATAAGDADSYQLFYTVNGLDTAVEASEVDAPVAVLRREYVADTAGAGRNRGGAAVRKDTRWLAPAGHNPLTLRMKDAHGFGVNGGGAGALGAAWLWNDPAQVGDYAAAERVAGVFDPVTGEADAAGEYAWYGGRRWATPADAVFRYVTPGGGGWGDPRTREPARVLVDVRDGYVTIDGARERYGVVIVGDPEWDPEGLVVDEAATAALRGA